tara:strand:+ start:437 stop:2179 length:1743 start_codon:yes stop_codon:yes gene_type:complete
MSLLKKGVKESVEFADEAAEFLTKSSDLLVQAYKEASTSGSTKAKEIAKDLSDRFDDDDIKVIADTFVNKIVDRTSKDAAGNKRISGGGFNAAAKEAADDLNKSDLIKPWEGYGTPSMVLSKDIKALKDLDNIRSGEGGNKGVDNFIDSISQYFRVLTRDKSLSSEYMGTLGDQARKTALKTSAKTASVLATGAGLGAEVTSLLNKDDDLTSKQEKIVDEYSNLTETSEDVTNITTGSISKAFSLATKNPSKYIFVEDGQPMIMYKGDKIEANMATNEKGTEIMLVPITKEAKSKGGSLLTRDTYEEGSKVKELSNAEQVIKIQDEGNIALKNARTQDQRTRIADNLEKMLANFSSDDLTDAAMLRTKLSGYDTDEVLFPVTKSMGGRMNKDEGSLMVPPEMEGDMPVDTYSNIPPEEMAEAKASQLPDAQMENQYMDFVLSESLNDEEQSYLMNALETDEKLSQIFDKVITTASEFTGSGEVDGPGTGVSDSIPARLSDGEFVFTKKATDQMGSDNLQEMMDDAERAYDGGEMRKAAQDGGLLLYNRKDEDPLAYEKVAQDEIKKNMLRSNRAPSLNPA